MDGDSERGPNIRRGWDRGGRQKASAFGHDRSEGVYRKGIKKRETENRERAGKWGAESEANDLHLSWEAGREERR